ncbi:MULTISPECIES: hypothetical protein [Paenibacillus]|uniref:hypothetical protein n=1 Tax=Paenibacillus TaxID=44249 RepID=UPI00096C596C|nr:hypothetical protein [Paenibacillus sp. FSL H8-0259]OMF21234.1 hypothetical protein BK132_33795 [Paenibacillus sp. FSL H8-0259]
MKIKEKSISFLSVILSVLICVSLFSIPAYANETNELHTAAAIGYDYPIKPGTSSWNELIDHTKMIEVSQIPDDTLKKLTTNELIETVLNYPLLMDIYAYDTLQQGIDVVSKTFNGIQELYQREDAPNKLIEKYQQMPVAKDTKTVTSNQIFDLSNMEIILRQDEIQKKLNTSEAEKLEKEVENKYLQKQAQKNIYGLTAASSYSVLAEKQGINVGTMSSYTVYTPNGTAVQVDKSAEQLTSDEKKAADNYVADKYSSATLLSPATSIYNCHSYAWYSQSTTNPYWMNYPNAYMTDGSYYQSSSPSVGGKVYYSTAGNEHSGVVTSLGRLTGYYVTSKWGQLGLVQHYYTTCPYYVSDSALRYYYR